MNYSQDVLLNKFQGYIKCKNDGRTDPAEPLYQLPFDITPGLCSGLVALWLYYKRIDMAHEFYSMLQYIHDWKETDFVGDDLVFEAALNNIIFLHFSYQLLNDLNQSSLDQSFNLLLGDQHPKVAASEFSMTWVFDKPSLAQLLNEITQLNKMIRFSDGLHTVALIKTSDGIFFYNPHDTFIPQSFANFATIVDKVFAALPLGRNTADKIALHINVFDLIGIAPTVLQNPEKYYTQTIQDYKMREALLNDPNIFHLAIRYSDQKTLALLFDNGYQYKPWEIHNTTELNEAVARNDMKMLLLLISHKIPLDYRTTEGLTALAVAVQQHNLDMLFTLTKHGADINYRASPYKTILEIACEVYNSEAIIFLLGCGYDVSEQELDQIAKTFKANTTQLYSKALALQKVLLQLPKKLSLETAKHAEIISVLSYCKLQQNLLHNLNGLEIIYEAKQYQGEDIYKAIDQYVNHTKHKDLHTFAEADQINKLLESLQDTQLRAVSKKELLDVLTAISREIVKKPITEYTAAELLEIKVVLNNVEDLLSSTKHKISEKDIHKVAQWLKIHIYEYLTQHQISNIDDYLKQKFPESLPKPQSLFYLANQYKPATTLDIKNLKQYVSLKLD